MLRILTLLVAIIMHAGGAVGSTLLRANIEADGSLATSRSLETTSSFPACSKFSLPVSGILLTACETSAGAPTTGLCSYTKNKDSTCSQLSSTTSSNGVYNINPTTFNGEVPTVFGHLPSGIVELDLTGTDITTFVLLQAPTTLQTINLENNLKLVSVTADFKHSVNLQAVSVSGSAVLAEVKIDLTETNSPNLNVAVSGNNLQSTTVLNVQLLLPHATISTWNINNNNAVNVHVDMHQAQVQGSSLIPDGYGYSGGWNIYSNNDVKAVLIQMQSATIAHTGCNIQSNNIVGNVEVNLERATFLDNHRGLFYIQNNIVIGDINLNMQAAIIPLGWGISGNGGSFPGPEYTLGGSIGDIFVQMQGAMFEYIDLGWEVGTNNIVGNIVVNMQDSVLTNGAKGEDSYWSIDGNVIVKDIDINMQRAAVAYWTIEDNGGNQGQLLKSVGNVIINMENSNGGSKNILSCIRENDAVGDVTILGFFTTGSAGICFDGNALIGNVVAVIKDIPNPFVFYMLQSGPTNICPYEFAIQGECNLNNPFVIGNVTLEIQNASVDLEIYRNAGAIGNVEVQFKDVSSSTFSFVENNDGAIGNIVVRMQNSTCGGGLDISSNGQPNVPYPVGSSVGNILMDIHSSSVPGGIHVDNNFAVGSVTISMEQSIVDYYLARLFQTTSALEITNNDNMGNVNVRMQNSKFQSSPRPSWNIANNAADAAGFSVKIDSSSTSIDGPAQVTGNSGLISFNVVNLSGANIPYLLIDSNPKLAGITLPSLQEIAVLSITNNVILKALSLDLTKTKGLTSLTVSGNLRLSTLALTKFPSSLLNATLSSNALTSFDEKLMDKSLTYLDLSGNSFPKCPVVPPVPVVYIPPTC